MSQDLSDVFGRPATAGLRDLLPRRGGEARPPEPAPEVATPASGPEADVTAPAAEADPPADVVPSVDVPAQRTPTRSGRRAGANPTTTNRTSTNRRWGVARVASRDHVDLLVLLALRLGPADGRGVITRLRESSGGQLDAPERTVHATLHRLARNRLLTRKPDPASGRHLYVLTAAGERAARSRLREWHALTRCMDAVAGTDATS
ncbi:MarR family winged helix-turn-helix transcriptional regulator [Actinomycetospora sp.]|jgi:DNA-binding PadR family transcriptional regulator|uniref:PadR family transcriptional regulator n=1 Tax=Actinomycetospora sp. TaxID=1872135 RepID=UPI002F3ECFAE